MKSAFMLRWRLFCFSHSFWVSLTILFSTTILFLFGSYSETGINDASNFFCWHFSDFTTLLSVCAILSGFQVCYSFQSRMIRYFVSAGMKRSIWILCEFLSWLACAFSMVCLDLVLSTGVAALFFRNERSLFVLFGLVVKVCLLSIPLYFGILSLFFAVGIAFQNGGITIAVNVVLTLFLYSSTRVVRSADFPAAALNPAYQLAHLAEVPIALSKAYLLSSVFSLFIGILFLGLSVHHFSNQELS